MALYCNRTSKPLAKEQRYYTFENKQINKYIFIYYWVHCIYYTSLTATKTLNNSICFSCKVAVNFLRVWTNTSGNYCHANCFKTVTADWIHGCDSVYRANATPFSIWLAFGYGCCHGEAESRKAKNDRSVHIRAKIVNTVIRALSEHYCSLQSKGQLW